MKDVDGVFLFAVLVLLLAAAVAFGKEDRPYGCTWCVCDVYDKAVIRCGPTRRGSTDELVKNIGVSGPGIMIPHSCGAGYPMDLAVLEHCEIPR